jgi:CarD family transcriptional regulator
MATKKTATKTKTKAKAKTKAKSAAKSSVSAKTKTAKAKTTRKTAAKKPAAKRAPAKKAAAKKKPVAKKAPAKKPAPKKVTPAKSKAKAAAKPAKSESVKKPAAPAKAAAPAKSAKIVAPAATGKPEFKKKEHIVYPAHGVGQIVEIEEREVAGINLSLYVTGINLSLYVITFDKDKMTLRVPIAKAKAVGMRRVSGPEVVKNALTTLKGRARIKRTMWSRRAQEYEAKINSGDLISIAEVVRDLHRGEGQPEQSYSERQLYEAAIDRMAREVAAADGLSEDAAVKKLESVLHKDAA